MRVSVGSVAGNIKVTWQAPLDDGGSPIIGYQLSLDGNLVYDGSSSASSTGYSFHNLSIGRDYTLTVVAINAIGRSEAAQLVTPAASVPNRPISIKANNATSSEIEIAWTVASFNGGASVSSYKVRRDSGPGTPYKPEIDILDPNVKVYKFSGLTAALRYTFQVQSVNLVGASDWSTATVFPAAAAPGSV